MPMRMSRAFLSFGSLAAIATAGSAAVLVVRSKGPRWLIGELPDGGVEDTAVAPDKHVEAFVEADAREGVDERHLLRDLRAAEAKEDVAGLNACLRSRAAAGYALNDCAAVDPKIGVVEQKLLVDVLVVHAEVRPGDSDPCQ